MRPLDLRGQKFGRLTVGALAINDGNGRRWHCQCDCGKQTIVRTEYLRTGDTKSCGCLQNIQRRDGNKTHGLSKQGRGSAYVSWMNMKGRCLNPNHRDYAIYGGRGISICDRWLNFEEFLEDMGHRPSRRHTLDRINPDGNYESSNCRWATPIQQARNTRRVIMILHEGSCISAMDIIEMALNSSTIGDSTISEFLARHGIAIGLRRLRKRMNGTVERRP